jgi:hypothetical protein
MSDVVKLLPIAAYVAVNFFFPGASPFWAFAAAAFTSYQAGRYQQRRAERQARDAYNGSLQDRLVMSLASDKVRSALFGEARNSDAVVFNGQWGANSQFLTLVVALCHGESDSIGDIYFDDIQITASDLTSDGAGGFWVQKTPFNRQPVISGQATGTAVGLTATVVLPNTPISGSVFVVGSNTTDNTPPSFTPGVVGNTVTCTVSTPGEFVTVTYQYLGSQPKARVWKYLGTPTQNIGTDLLASRFPSLINTGTDPTTGLPNSDRFAGITALVVELEYDQDAFPSGIPNISAVVRGQKVLDVRTGSTAWTENPALIARAWSLASYGGACLTSEVVDSKIIAAANACDVSTNFVTPTGTVVQPLFQCGIVCPLDGKPDDALSEIIESMAGKWGWAGGQLSVVAGTYRAPVVTITEDWVSDAGSIKIMPQAQRVDLVNVIKPTISDSAQNYVSAAMPQVRSAAYITADGQELVLEVQFSGVTDNTHAQHVAGVMMREAREALTVELPCKFHAWQLELFDVVRLTLPVFGFVAKEFEVLGWRFGMGDGVTLSLKETGASIYDPAANFDNPNAVPNSALVLPWVVAPITGLAVTSGIAALLDGTQQARALVSWTPAAAANVTNTGNVEIQYVEATGTLPTGDWPSVMSQGSGSSVTIPGLLSGRYYLFKARAINTIGVRSAWSAQISVLMAPAPQVSGDNLIANSSFEVDSNADGLADAWTAYQNGTTGTITRSIQTVGLYGAKVQRIAAAGLGTTNADRIGVQQTISVVGAGNAAFWFSAYASSSSGSPKAQLFVDFRDVSNASVGTVSGGEFSTTTSLTRHFTSGTVPATAVTAILYMWGSSRPGGAGLAAVDFDGVQFQVGGVMTGYSPRADEILAGAVGTPQLANNAATEIYSTTPGSAVTVTAVAHTPDGFTWNTQIMTVSFTPAASGVAQVYVDARGNYTADALGAGYPVWSIQDTAGTGTYDAWKRLDGAGIPASTSGSLPISTTRSISVTGGVAYTFALYANKFKSGDTFTIDNMQMRVEVVKR